MNKFAIALIVGAIAAPVAAQTLPLSQSTTFQTKANVANPIFTGTPNVYGPAVRVTGPSNNEGMVALESSHNQTQTGYVSFYLPDQVTRVGYVGFGTSAGINLTSVIGSIYLNPAGAPNPMIVGTDSAGKLQIVINNLPVSCSGEPTGTLYVSGHNVLIC